ncbi:Ada metal-binding domain-containing protein [uncultured Mucilaginibacter sp.]|uniref:Ada metal-binding domain-containing protein n=1 Tax=uncultured Mucilaginibacter sp. TaxID=797541 RepID=UPI0025D44F93|nr:Ada metal-binding domain-containing protein [uncultured Mucilaginibacter sp.]
MAFKRSRNLKILLDKKELTFAGNANLKIYGILNCSSGKRMKPENRIFFSSETEAIEMGYRPCGRCLVFAYKNWLQLKKC